jgi:hypothetical protein
MLEKFLNIFRIPDLRKRVLFTLGILAVYRLGAFIPTPGVNAHQLELMFNQQSGSALGLMDLFGGGNLRRMTIFALGIMPYITASIIFQLLTVVYEPLARIQKEGELGRRKITQWTRYMTVVLGALQSIGIAAILTKQGLVTNPGIGFDLMTVLTLTTGTAFIMWLGEQITDSEGSNERMGIVHHLRGFAYRGGHGGGGRVHCLCGAVGAANPDSERAAYCGPADDGGPIEPLAAEGELGRCHARDLCQLNFVGTADVESVRSGAEQPFSAAHHPGSGARLSVV